MHLTASFIGDDMKKLFFPANLWLQVSRWWQRLSATWNSRNRVQTKESQHSQNASSPKRATFWTLQEIEGVVNSLYERRLNVLSGRTEYRRLDDGENSLWRRVDKRFYHTLMSELQARGMLYGWPYGLQCAVENDHVTPFHPVRHYLGHLPAWDGTERLRPLMERLTRDSFLVHCLSTWFLSFVRQATGDDLLFGNSVAPLLVSEEQGLHKSTFCRLLLPPELRFLYTDTFDLSAKEQTERKMTQKLLINLDEFDRFNARKQACLKNEMQKTSLSLKENYQNNLTELPRLASFIGTSNNFRLLTDPTGNRRFICVEITEMIDVETPIDYPQLYAECLQRIAEGAPCYLTHDEEAVLGRMNMRFSVIQTIEDLVLSHFRHPQADEPFEQKSAAEVYAHLAKADPQAMKAVCEQNFGAVLRRLGFTRHEHNHRMVYYMVRNE